MRWAIGTLLFLYLVVVPLLPTSWVIAPQDFSVKEQRGYFVRVITPLLPWDPVLSWQSEITALRHGGPVCGMSGRDVYEHDDDHTVSGPVWVWMGDDCTSPGIYEWRSEWRAHILFMPMRPVEMTRIVEVR